MIMFQQFSNGMKCNFESAKSKKMGDIMFFFRGGYDFMLFHDLSGQTIIIFPPAWIFQCSLLKRNFSPQKKLPKIYVTGLQNDILYSWTWMSVVDPGCFGPSFLLVPCWSCQPATILTKDIRRFDGTESGLEKQTTTLLEYCTLHFRGKKTYPLQENNIKNSTWIIRPSLDAGFSAQNYMKLRVSKTRKFSPQSPDH